VARPRSPHRNALILAFVAALCVVVGAGAALISDNGNNGGRATPAPKATASKSQGAPTGGAVSGTSTAQSTTPQAPADTTTTETPAAATGGGDTATTPAPTTDGRSAVDLNNAGYALLPRDPQSAVPLLSAAVEKFRSTGATSGTDYAYSLYNYGWALRLAGRPAEAIPYLQERLRISDYKRGIVEQELKTAQAAAGVTPTATAGHKGKDKPGKGAGRKRG
jgi:serine/threonine-protein kinase